MTGKTMNILVVGSIALDSVETPWGSAEDSPGGSALYFSSAASYFAPVNIVGVVGKDFDFGAIDFLRGRGVNFDGIDRQQGLTFRWGGRYHMDLNQRDTLFTQLNVFENFNPKIPASYRNSDLVFLANIDPDLQLQVLGQIPRPKLVILDTMNFWITGKRSSLDKVIGLTDVLILNDEEARMLTDTGNLITAGRRILERGPKFLIIKKGEHGAILIHEQSYFAAPAYPVEKVVDPTGAGDSFAGGFVGYIASTGKIDEPTMRKAIIYGSTIASFNVEDFSFRRLISLSKDDMEGRMNEFSRITAY
jgi:sugar/nucleoside kinase (ribokinase family)